MKSIWQCKQYRIAKTKKYKLEDSYFPVSKLQSHRNQDDKDRHFTGMKVDKQYNRFESPEINPHIYDQLFFNKGAKTIRGMVFSTNGGKQLDMHMQKNDIRPFLHIIYKN